VQQEVVLALLAKEPSHGYQLSARLRQALGPLGDAMNDGQVYVTLAWLEKAGLVTSEQAAGLPDRPDRKVYELTPVGQQRAGEWLTENRLIMMRDGAFVDETRLTGGTRANLADLTGLG
jgi:DNA-binding PadR family transcriptional regulator